MKVHYVKCLPEFFKLIVNGKKRFEIRYDDRKYEIGDLVILREWENGIYSTEKICKTIDYVLRQGERYGLMKKYSIIQFADGSTHYDLFDTVGANSGQNLLECP